MKQAQSAANSLKRGGSDVSVTQIASAAGGGGSEVDVDFEIEKKTSEAEAGTAGCDAQV